MEHGLSKTDIAGRLGIHRSTVDEHLQAVETKLAQGRANGSRQKRSVARGHSGK
jgi:DNA-binding NarL/FixJ family response regulator